MVACLPLCCPLWLLSMCLFRARIGRLGPPTGLSEREAGCQPWFLAIPGLAAISCATKDHVSEAVVMNCGDTS